MDERGEENSQGSEDTKKRERKPAENEHRDEKGREPEEKISQDKDEEEVEDIYHNITEGGESVK